MRDFSWKYFAMTGDVDAYMLYKEHGGITMAETAAAPEMAAAEETETHEENE
ncbi:YqzL family protein [Paenibacillus chibensis]|uniref:YqzL family protein n=1 Tax=Paenibacillus chibensis TaxID=59846 RepID=A0ABU6PZP2_9BACL|nr:YqzL family protein [Paenibacillus chibensis]MEC0369903.1 YqzL family protein [Paenibacillus chibensis]MED5020355.1 YqzL family protein [Paenibacillus chibensis]